ncbi:MAG: pantetheine-phosphate adenylyltransferase [Gemmatimonadota bacterium]|nr:MAG: pantetheine-phosphate adenylyltransferase [Gemmatimonadota bacterium]
MTRIAIYPGSFDPVTRGHEDIIRRSLAFADKLVVAVAVNLSKQPLFTLEERLDLLREVLQEFEGVEIRWFDGLLAKFAQKNNASLVIRGLRAVSDFEYEFQMALMNRQLFSELETVFLTPAVDLTFLSSSLVREVAELGGDVSDFVHPAVGRALAEKFA